MSEAPILKEWNARGSGASSHTAANETADCDQFEVCNGGPRTSGESPELLRRALQPLDDAVQNQCSCRHSTCLAIPAVTARSTTPHIHEQGSFLARKLQSLLVRKTVLYF